MDVERVQAEEIVPLKEDAVNHSDLTSQEEEDKEKETTNKKSRIEMFSAEDFIELPDDSSKGLEKDDYSGNKIPVFLAKTFEIFSNPDYSDFCGFGPNGDTIVIKKVPAFCSILPLHFKHENLQSFIRQLNMYDFHKTAQDPSNHEFHHTYFQKGRPDLLVMIKRKVGDQGRNHPSVGRAPAISQPEPQSMINQTDLVLSELVALRHWRVSIQEKLDTLVNDNQKILRENDLLWQSLQQHALTQRALQHKMQKVLYFMYDMYLSSGGNHQEILPESGQNLFSNGNQSLFGQTRGAIDRDQLRGRGLSGLKDAEFLEKLKILGLEAPVSPFEGATNSNSFQSFMQNAQAYSSALATSSRPTQSQMNTQEAPSTFCAPISKPTSLNWPSHDLIPETIPTDADDESLRKLAMREQETREKISKIEDSLSKLFEAEDFCQLVMNHPSFSPVMEDQVISKLSTAASERQKAAQLQHQAPHQLFPTGLGAPAKMNVPFSEPKLGADLLLGLKARQSIGQQFLPVSGDFCLGTPLYSAPQYPIESNHQNQSLALAGSQVPQSMMASPTPAEDLFGLFDDPVIMNSKRKTWG